MIVKLSGIYLFEGTE